MGNAEHDVGATDNAALGHRLLDLATASWMAHTVRVAAELRIADLLADKPRTSDDLARAADCHAPSLHRLLRALTTVGVCRQREDGAFETTPMGGLLRADVPGSIRSYVLWWGVHLEPVWDQLLYSVKTGQSARTHVLGTEGFEHLADPEVAALFHRALAERTALVCDGVVRAYGFSGLRRVADVGGGRGDLLVAILGANPGVKGILMDLPSAVEAARYHVEAAGLDGRCEFVSGDFFESVPAGADAYVLKSVLHDWSDDRGRCILENCRRAMAPDGRLLLVEGVLPARPEATAAHREAARDDLNMLVAHGARERTEAEFCELLASAGLRMARIAPAGFGFSVLEALPVS